MNARRMAASLALAALAGCEGARQDMYDQPKSKPMASSSAFADGTVARTPPDGTVVHAAGPFAATSSGRAGTEVVRDDRAAREAATQPYPLSAALLARGRERYDIYCAACHSVSGDGDGWVVRRGFPRPPSYHQPRLRSAPDRHLYDVIGKGYGIMYPFADKIVPADRWAIVAYIRALQLSQHAPAAALPADMRAQLPPQPGAAP